MELNAAKCPNCGGELQIPDNVDNVKCMYCATGIAVLGVTQRYDDSININNMFLMAEAAESAENYQESYNYYTKILELNPRNHKAWYGRAISAGWLSTPDNIRLTEVIAGIDKALEIAPENEKETLSCKAGVQLNDINVMIAGIVINNFIRYVTSETHEEFLAKMYSVILSYKKASTLKPNDVTIYKNIIDTLLTTMKRYRNYNNTKEELLDDQGYSWAKQTILEAEAQINKTNPEYKASIPAYEKSGCYIATAIYGDYNSNEVLILRKFRDNTLSQNALGRLFIAGYYKYSPGVAAKLKPQNIISRLVRSILNIFISYLRKATHNA